MRKIILFNMVTLDGFFEGPDRELNWHRVDAEFTDFAIEQLNEVDLHVFGRVTYQLMSSYWSTQDAIQTDPIVAGLMSNTPKIVFSKTLKEVHWNKATLIHDDPAGVLASLKNQPGKDIIILGSAVLSGPLMDKGLIDEYRIMINPVAIGKGKSLFQTIHGKLNFQLIGSKTFGSGIVLLYYKPAAG